MASIGHKLETKGVIMTLLSLVLISTGCEEQIDTPAVNPSEGKTVEVTLNIGLADETDGYTLSAPSETKSSVTAFNYALQPAMATKGAESSLKPDKLYNLEIQQYDRSGNRIGGMSNVIAEQEIGSALKLTLTANIDCQLVIVAWGKSNTSTTLDTGNLTSAQTKSIDASVISELNPSNQEDMNQMPYVLHLEHVCVENNTIKSIEGKEVRLLLRRLATRLILNWSYSYSGYQLKQILLQSIPLNYKVVAAPDKDDKTYPSLLDQYITIQLTSTQIGAGNYSCWVPANVRGTNSLATSQTYRIKSNAPTGSSYVDFIAANTSDLKKKLSYRVYLGGSESTDFNLYSNTDYNYTVKISHIDLPVNDRRVTIIDPIAASENNNNLVPTANCFIVAPGGAFCFNPYTYYVKGNPVENSLLQGWCSTKKIQSVKVLWQTKENGDVGDPALGVVTSSDDHTNIVDLKNGGDFGNARIYCRVAPNTTGGSGVIAACDIDGNILWSWHVWITNYSPSATANETILTPENKRILKLERNGVSYNPIMDRCLGAYDGYVSVPKQIVNMSRANGFHYQKGRKDPFPGSYPSEDLGTQYHFTIDGKQPPRHCLNRYEPDGITWIMPSSLDMTSLLYAYQHPESLGSGWNHEWARFSPVPTWSTDKTIHDPCPAGWRVPSKNELQILVDYNQPNQNSILSNYKIEGGALFQYDGTSNRTYMRFSGYPVSVSHIANIGYAVYLQTNQTHQIFYAQGNGGAESTNGITFVNKDNYDANNIRCIQDK